MSTIDSQKSSDKSKNESYTLREIWFQIFAALVSTSLAFHVGVNVVFSTLIISPDLLIVTEVGGNDTNINETFYNTHDERDDFLITSKVGASWIASVVTVTMGIGCPISGLLMDRLGRRLCCNLTAIILTIAWIVTALSGKSIGLLYAGRALTGFGAGMSLLSVPYVAEITHHSIRSRILPLFPEFAAVGTTTATLMGYCLPWRMVAVCCALIALLTTVLSFFIPESPVWLQTTVVDDEKRKEKVMKSIQTLYRERKFVEAELDNLQSLRQKVTSENMNKQSSVMRELLAAWKPMCLLFIMFFLQQTSGCIVVMSYALQIFQVVGSVKADPWLSLIGLGVVRVVMSFVPLLNIGRRKLLLYSSAGMTSFMMLSGCFLHYSGPSLIPVVGILGFVLCSSFGVLVLPGAFTGEFLPNTIRGTGAGIIHLFKFAVLFAITKFFIPTMDAIGPDNIMFSSAIISLITFVFVYLFIPETLGKSFEEIAKNF